MPKIYFTSGKVENLEMTPADLDNMIVKMKGGGIRLLKFKNGSYIPLNSNTIEIITCEDCVSITPPVIVPVIASTEAVGIEKEIEVLASIEPEPVVKEDGPKTTLQREQEVLAEIINKSNCTHGGFLTYHKIDGKKGARYFQVCSFCGWRGRYVRGDSLTDEEKTNAKVYTEK